MDFVSYWGIEYTDLFILGTACILGGFAVLTPHKWVAALVITQFVTFIVFDAYLYNAEIDLNPKTDLICSLGHIAFAMGFFILWQKDCLKTSLSYSILFIVIGLYYLFLSAFGMTEHYQLVMVVFCLLQLLGLMPGAYEGIRYMSNWVKRLKGRPWMMLRLT